MELGRIRFVFSLFVWPRGVFSASALFSFLIEVKIVIVFRFVINSYLRARLEKIESQVWHYTGPGEAGSRMTQV